MRPTDGTVEVVVAAGEGAAVYAAERLNATVLDMEFMPSPDQRPTVRGDAVTLCPRRMCCRPSAWATTRGPP